MTNYFTVYDSVGCILFSGHGPQESALLIPDGGGMVWGLSGDPNTEYVSDGEIVPKKVMDRNLIPQGSTIICDGEVICSDFSGTTLEFVKDPADSFDVEVSHPHYLNLRFTI